MPASTHRMGRMKMHNQAETPTFLQQPAYQLFRQAYAERKAPLVLICGSGLSTPAGLPSWTKLREILQKSAEDKISSLNQMGRTLYDPKVEAVKKTSDPWVAFKLIKEILTRPIFDQIVERELTPLDDVPTPKSYSEILKLNPRGIITLNLDKFAEQSLAVQQKGSPITPIFGKEIAKKWNYLQASKTYLVYLHGGLHDPSSWVLTQDDLSEISSSEGHRHFLQTVFTENVVLFVGVSADDVALSKRLIELTSADFRPKNIYWFTNRLTPDLYNWADRAYVSIINYSATNLIEHDKAVFDLVNDCISFVSKDIAQAPLEGSSSVIQADESISSDPEDLAQEHPEQVRRKIAHLLDRELENSESTDDVIEKYRTFCERYDFAVHRAFYRGKGQSYRKWFGYELDMPSLGRGNFGEVYSARDQDGNSVAVKIMHESIFGNNDMLGGFRRGVRSMRIVTDHNVEGMVKIHHSFELPPTIIMPYISGVSLEEALRSRSDISWPTKVSICRSIGRIVTSAHALPQTILHRDLKPSNIMVTNFEYEGGFDPEIVVLDFDMSWHKGSKERDIIFESRDDFGYLAPEQTDASNRYAARSTRVDSYGFGMTMFYVFGHEAPRPNEALSDRWTQRAIAAAENGYDGNWKSAPIRLGRLIARATEIDQNLRIDFATIGHELDYIFNAVTDSTKLVNPELWAEEIMSHIADGKHYKWDDATASGKYMTPSGISAEILTNFRSESVILSIKYTDKGTSERGNLGKYLSNAVQSSDHLFHKNNWKVIEKRHGGGEALIKAEIEMRSLILAREQCINAAKSAMNEFR